MNIFVAKLNYDTGSEGIQELFEQFGQVDSAKVIMDRDTGRSKGFGFVEMPNDEEAREAINDLNGSEVDGREIVVKEAKPRENNRGGYNNNRGGYNNNRGGGYNNRY